MYICNIIHSYTGYQGHPMSDNRQLEADTLYDLMQAIGKFRYSNDIMHILNKSKDYSHPYYDFGPIYKAEEVQEGVWLADLQKTGAFLELAQLKRDEAKAKRDAKKQAAVRLELAMSHMI